MLESRDCDSCRKEAWKQILSQLEDRGEEMKPNMVIEQEDFFDLLAHIETRYQRCSKCFREPCMFCILSESNREQKI